MKNPRRPLLALLALSSACALAFREGSAQGLRLGGDTTSPHVRWKVAVRPAKAAPGDRVEVIASYELADGWHLYAPDFEGTGLPTKLRVDAPPLEAKGDPVFPEPVVVKKEVIGIETHRLLAGKGEIRQSYAVSEDTPEGRLDFQALLTYMTCDANTCDPPEKDEPYPLTLEIARGGAGATAGDGEGGNNAVTGTARGKERSAERDTTNDAERAPAKGIRLPGDGLFPGLPGPAGTESGSQGDETHVTWKVRVKPAAVRRGETAHIVVEYTVADGFYIYPPDHVSEKLGGVPTRVSVDAPGIELRGEPSFPEPKKKELLGETFGVLTGKGEIRQGFAVLGSAEPGDLEFRVSVSFMTCWDSGCDPPGKHTADVSVTVSDEPPLVVEAPQDEGPQDLTQIGIWSLVLLMIGGGVFALMMPCTYPMIPITIAFFTKQAEARGGRVLSLALLYGAGIVLSFNVIGILFAGPIVGFSTNAWVNFVFGVVFLLFALVLFGIVGLRLPPALTNLASRASSTSGYLGVFFLGATLVVTSFTCTAPIMGTLLIIAAEGGSTARVVAGMSAFGTTMAVPFVLLAVFPAYVKSLPRSGEWMNTLKVSLGFLELAACVKFFSNAEIGWGWWILPRELFLTLWSGIAAVTGLYLLGVFHLKNEERHGIGGLRMLFGMGCIVLALYFHSGSSGNRLDSITEALSPPYGTGRLDVPVVEEAGGGAENPIIAHDLEEGLEKAKALGVRAFIDFTGPL